MDPRTNRFFIRAAALCAGVTALISGDVARAQDQVGSQETRAAAVIGSSDVAVLSLIRELSSWKERALKAEGLLSSAGVTTTRAQSGSGSDTRGSQTSSCVLNALEEERIVILSLGRARGAMQGALLSIGGGVVAKVVESREEVSAAVVDNSYKGKLVTLEGLPVKLAVR